jgi:hypothetical protein
MQVGTVPYMSNLTANKYGLSAWFSDTMPLNHIYDSLNGILSFQSGGQTANPEVLDVTTPGLSGCRPPLIMSPSGAGCITPEQAAEQGYVPPKPTDCSFGDIPCYISKLFTCDASDPKSAGCLVQDAGIRLGLIVLALILIATVIISFR